MEAVYTSIRNARAVIYIHLGRKLSLISTYCLRYKWTYFILQRFELYQNVLSKVNIILR